MSALIVAIAAPLATVVVASAIAIMPPILSVVTMVAIALTITTMVRFVHL